MDKGRCRVWDSTFHNRAQGGSMYQNKKIAAIILVAGNGARFSNKHPKQFYRLSGKPVYWHTVQAFLEVSWIDEIICVCHPDYLDACQHEMKNIPSVVCVSGGKSRQESSYMGLKNCSSDIDFVLIHDGVRPFVSSKIILDNINQVLIHLACDTCIPSADTIVELKTSHIVKKIPNRSLFYRGQTPQSFSYPLIVEAHQKAIEAGVQDATDDCALVARLGHDIYVVEGSEKNIKITTELDLLFAEQLIRLKTHFLIGKERKEKLAGKQFIVVGGTGGIGRIICNKLKEEKAYPIVLSPSSSFCFDLRNPSQIQEVLEHIAEEYGKVDGLINVAGYLEIGALSSLTLKQIKDLIDINYTGTVLCCRYAKIKPKGHIINVASSSYIEGRKDYSIYSSSKAAIVNFTQAIAQERQEQFINCIIPQRTNTSLRRKSFLNEDATTLLSPEQVAEAVMNCLSQHQFTGCILEVKKDLSLDRSSQMCHIASL